MLEGNDCIRPASVFDPVSARIARSVGFEVAMFAGSVASAVVLGAPDIVVLTLSEFAEQARRITRAADLSLIVDADHGYGNALNVMRTVQELENAGVSALTLEDTVFPRPFRQQKGQEMLAVEAMKGNLKAALAARQDPSLVIVGRTAAAGFAGADEAARRVEAYSSTGVDAVFLTGLTSREELEKVRIATSLPLMLGSTPPELEDLDYLAGMGVRVALAGHLPFQIAVKATYEAMYHLSRGGSPRDLQDSAATAQLMDVATGQEQYSNWREQFLE